MNDRNIVGIMMELDSRQGYIMSGQAMNEFQHGTITEDEFSDALEAYDRIAHLNKCKACMVSYLEGKNRVGDTRVNEAGGVDLFTETKFAEFAWVEHASVQELSVLMGDLSS